MQSLFNYRLVSSRADHCACASTTSLRLCEAAATNFYVFTFLRRQRTQQQRVRRGRGSDELRSFATCSETRLTYCERRERAKKVKWGDNWVNIFISRLSQTQATTTKGQQEVSFILAWLWSCLKAFAWPEPEPQPQPEHAQSALQTGHAKTDIYQPLPRAGRCFNC